MCSNFKIINDIAERNVALMKEYNLLFTQNEGEKQDIVLQVAQNRKDLPDFNKKSILKSINKRR